MTPTTEEGQDQVLYGADKIIEFIIPLFTAIRKRLDICVDYTTPSLQFATEPVWKAYLETSERGIKIRYLTDIRKENIYHCKELVKLKHLELRHLEGVTLNFGMADGRDCFIHLADKEGESLTSALYTTSKGFVEAQKHLFETLWNKATTAQERIKDIEEGLKPGFIQSFEDRYEVQKKALDLIGSAKQEILGIFSSINTDSNLLSRLKEEDNKEKQQQEQLPRQEHDGIQLLKQAAIRGVSIRIIARNENAFIKELKQQVLPREQQSQQNKIQIQFFQPNFQKVPITLIIDRKESLLVELIDEQKPNEPFSKSMEMSRATYSNNEYTVSSYISIFETLWMQNELSTIPGDIAKAQ